MESGVDIYEMLSLQLAEVEMLQSMFPQTGELVLDDPLAVDAMQTFLDEKRSYDSLNERISFTLNIEVGDEGEKKKLSLMCRFPHEYPSIPPEIFLQSEALSRTNHRKLSDDLHNYILELDRGEICMCYAIQWLQDNADQYFEEVIEVVQTKEPKTDPYFSRMWIYSHHIYSKWKRADIQTYSKQFDLTGFLMPGKPGIIAIEGYRNNVEDFWHRVRRMTWKRIMMKEREDVELNESITVDKCRVFTGFGEKYFEPRQGKGRGGHGDRGLLFQFLEEHGCAHIFPLYFGVEGKSTEADSD